MVKTKDLLRSENTELFFLFTHSNYDAFSVIRNFTHFLSKTSSSPIERALRPS